MPRRDRGDFPPARTGPRPCGTTTRAVPPSAGMGQPGGLSPPSEPRGAGGIPGNPGRLPPFFPLLILRFFGLVAVSVIWLAALLLRAEPCRPRGCLQGGVYRDFPAGKSSLWGAPCRGPAGGSYALQLSFTVLRSGSVVSRASRHIASEYELASPVAGLKGVERTALERRPEAAAVS